MSLSTTPDRPRGGRLALEALAVLAIALLVMAVARGFQPLGLIGLVNDDGLYALYAKALHLGKGYIDLSNPTPRPASRYPIGMPGLLALVAMGTTSVQAMIARFEWVPVVFAGFYTVTCYAYFRRFAHMGAVASGALTVGIAMSYSPMFAAFNVMSDMPCAVLTLWTLMALERLWHRPWEGSRPWMGWALAGVLAGVAFLFRYSSASLFVAIALAMSKDRKWKPMIATFVGAALPLLPWFLFRASLGGETYASEYRERFPVLGKLLYAFGHSAGSLIAEAIPALLLPLGDVRSLATLAIGALVSTLVLFGAVRWFREPRAHETPLAPSYVLATLAMTLIWQMSYLYLQLDLAGRLLVAAIPLMALCLGRGIYEVGLLLGGRDLPWRRIAMVACLALAAVRLVPLGVAMQRGENPFVARPAPAPMLQMFDHIRQTVKPNEVLYAWNGPMVALYTDRTSYPLLVMYSISTVDVTRTLLRLRPAYVLGWPNYNAEGQDTMLALINAFQKEVPNVLLTEWVSPDPRLVLFRVDYAELDRQVAAAKAAPNATPKPAPTPAAPR